MMPGAANMPQRARHFLDFLVCGLPAHKRERRFMAVYGAFVDDSGSHAQSPMMVLVGLVAKHEAWKEFSDEWYAALIADKPLKSFKGHIYFKAADAQQRKHCFEGFTKEEVDQKINLLTDITLKYIDYGTVAAILWKHFREVVQAQIVKPKGRLIKFAEHPYDLCFHALTANILNEQLRRDHHEEIDFAFDQQGSLLLRCINWYNEYKKKAPEPLRKIMGLVVPGDDKVLLPIQAADLVAWQVRNRFVMSDAEVTESVTKIADSKKIYKRPISKPELQDFIAGLNTAAGIRNVLRALGIDITTDQVVEILAKVGEEVVEAGAEADVSETEEDSNGD